MNSGNNSKLKQTKIVHGVEWHPAMGRGYRWIGLVRKFWVDKLEIRIGGDDELLCGDEQAVRGCWIHFRLTTLRRLI